ncbi:hypothetical protein BDQ17DRAFT_810367 [Cyathus striatus]|nr:hypothetical protein BDQ17DRAFT_810367 [Cyathus striatus]
MRFPKSTSYSSYIWDCPCARGAGDVLTSAFRMLIFLLRSIYINVVLLYLPKYYATHAHLLLLSTKHCDKDYLRWSTECEEYEASQSRPSSGFSHILSSMSPIHESPVKPFSVHILQSSWIVFFNERRGEYQILLTVSGIFLASWNKSNQDAVIRTSTPPAVANAVFSLLGVATIWYLKIFRLWQ